jgi:hypothetical protein
MTETWMDGGELASLADELREIITNARNGRPYDRERARLIASKLSDELRTPHYARPLAKDLQK